MFSIGSPKGPLVSLPWFWFKRIAYYWFVTYVTDSYSCHLISIPFAWAYGLNMLQTKSNVSEGLKTSLTKLKIPSFSLRKSSKSLQKLCMSCSWDYVSARYLIALCNLVSLFVKIFDESSRLLRNVLMKLRKKMMEPRGVAISWLIIAV